MICTTHLFNAQLNELHMHVISLSNNKNIDK